HQTEHPLLWHGSPALQKHPSERRPSCSLSHWVFDFKGELVRSILFPKPVGLKLYSDLLKCMVIFFLLGTVPVIYTAVISIQLRVYVGEALLFVLNVVTFFVPPSLPAVLTSINEQAQRRLRKQGIYCLNSRYINFAGGLDVVCFDKTGTLTEDDLDILAAVPVRDQKFESAVLNLDQISSEDVIKAMATCHSLARIDGEVKGYNLDQKMFQLTGWGLQEPTLESHTAFDYVPPRIVTGKTSSGKEESIAIVKMFPFESSLKRMSVVTQTEGRDHFDVFLKGAPELVITLSRKETVPDDVLEKLTRDFLEKDLEFLGLVVLENKLKPETIPALNTLKDADIRSVMVTGDNLLTAITVSKKCGMIEEHDSVVIIKAELVSSFKSTFKNLLKVAYNYANFPISGKNGALKDMILEKSNGHFNDTYVPIEEQCHVAMDGETFNLIRQYDSELLEKVVLKGAIFARMLPEHKLYLIESFQNLGYHVGMCGDGANDCGALKTAHTGVSLSMAEASVAAPFTSTQQNVQCIPTLIR
ncbi:probable cation-transporting ATPase 13A3, partial [Trichonephila clavata]